MKNKKLFLILGGLLLIGGASYYFFKDDIKGLFAKLMGNDDGSDSKVGSSSSSTSVKSSNNVIDTIINPSSSSTPIVTKSNEAFPLKKGMKGPIVKVLQDSLNTVYKSKLIADGDFGTLTQTAVSKNLGTTTVSQANYDKLVQSAVAINKLGGAGSSAFSPLNMW